MRSLVIGLGRAGAGLHLPVLLRLRATSGPFTPAPVVGVDPAGVPGAPGLRAARSIGHAAHLLEPDRTVVHVCTPPTTRTAVLTELAAHGFRNVLVEKPLATGAAELAAVLRLRDRLRMLVIAPWLASRLTGRLVRLTEDGTLGELRTVSVVQHKPRFHRSTSTAGHPTAFDVELPHALGVVLRLAGAAEVLTASCTDLVLDDLRRPWLGHARLRLRHADGTLSRFTSDLTSPVRTRRITLRFAYGTVTGHYPIGADDDTAQLTVTTRDERRHTAFRDDALGAFLLDAYRRFARPGDPGADDLDLAADVVRLLTTAKERCGAIPGRSRRAAG
jgi:predicted dehydrogenase